MAKLILFLMLSLFSLSIISFFVYSFPFGLIIGLLILIPIIQVDTRKLGEEK